MLGKKNVDVLAALKKRNIDISAPQFCTAFQPESNEPRQIQIREETERIITEWESEPA
jgi:hypothetical protein